MRNRIEKYTKRLLFWNKHKSSCMPKTWNSTIQNPSFSQKRIALVGPLPPVRSGIADYNHRIIEELQHICSLDIFVPNSDSLTTPMPFPKARVFLIQSLGQIHDPKRYNRILYTLGNSFHHIPTLHILQKIPGILWLHDVRLPGLFLSDAYSRYSQCQLAAYVERILKRHYKDIVERLQPQQNDYLETEWYSSNRLGMTRPLLPYAKSIILHSEHAESVLRDEQPDHSLSTPIIRLPLACPTLRSSHSLSKQTPKQLATFGYVSTVKAPDILIRAFSLLKPEYPQLQLVFVGTIEPELREELLALIQFENIPSDSIQFTGYVTSKEYYTWLRKTDIAILLRRSTNGESSAAGNDCLAAGIPTISNLPAHKEYPKGVLKILSEQPDHTELAAAISALMSSDKERYSCHSAALNYAQKTSFYAVAEQMLDSIQAL